VASAQWPVSNFQFHVSRRAAYGCSSFFSQAFPLSTVGENSEKQESEWLTGGIEKASGRTVTFLISCLIRESGKIFLCIVLNFDANQIGNSGVCLAILIRLPNTRISLRQAGPVGFLLDSPSQTLDPGDQVTIRQ
jgi:hypothetical protein